MDHTATDMEDLSQKIVQSVSQFTELGEDQDTFPLLVDGFRQFPQHL